jgi:hypothetical protein
VPSTVETYLIKVRFAHSLPPAVNRSSYPGATIRKNLRTKEILNALQNNEMPIKIFESK